ncbi:MAG TPA: hypothetical protein DEQ26_07995 [Flavobacteriaceae bacterium]|nr:hypothetical protein [Flavobacteriaceae bacterium]
MSIKIEFLLKGENEFIRRDISYEEYFDLEENEKIEIDSIPKFSQPYLYLNINVEKILLVIVEIEINNNKKIFKQTIWNNGDNILTERIDNDNYKEIILSVKIEEATGLYETIRLFVGNKITVPTYHSLIYLDKNGRDIEKRFNTDIYIEMIKKSLIN